MPIEVELVGQGVNWAAWVHAALTLTAVVVAIVLPQWQLRRQEIKDFQTLEKRHVVALQALYHEVRLLDHLFGQLVLELQKVEDPLQSTLLRNVAYGNDELSGTLPRSVAESRYKIVADLHADAASLYASTLVRFRTVMQILETTFGHPEDPRYPALAYDEMKKSRVFGRLREEVSMGWSDAKEFALEAEQKAPRLRELSFRAPTGEAKN
ncbi:hypothetical protein J2T57_002640 [Natronocella acetinitrilica]|uniref:Uncharacterized protein n=1 Tax=Natronocella acetinitrilica TaxID=414046 RepID=A0AAE3G471_9GAMM|nr:hypothetical protein [Natronocella acetinitrilica]MCP1675490.1 hypothetical protein [Natronocella acetinitrilica]